MAPPAPEAVSGAGAEVARELQHVVPNQQEINVLNLNDRPERVLFIASDFFKIKSIQCL